MSPRVKLFHNHFVNKVNKKIMKGKKHILNTYEFLFNLSTMNSFLKKNM